jgi:DDE domain
MRSAPVEPRRPRLRRLRWCSGLVELQRTPAAPRGRPPVCQTRAGRPGATTVRHANNRIEADHGGLKHRLRPMRGLCTDRTAQVVFTGLAFPNKVRRGHYELATETVGRLRVASAFTELALGI